MNAGGLFGNLLGYGALAIVLSCVIFLVSLFLLAPLPYIISAAVLKIPNRGYWKAFGSAVLGGLAGAATTAVVVLILAAVTGTFANMRNITSSSTGMLGLFGGLMIIGWLVGWAGSIVVEMAITGGLYQVGFGKGALIWLLAVVFGFLIGVVITLILFVVSAATGAALFNQVKNLLPGGLQYYVPQLLALI